MKKKKIGVGIIGLQPGRSWGAVAHVPALRSLPEDFEIVGVANSSRESAEAAASACDLPRGFSSPDELLACPEVDVVTVTVKVPHHFELVRRAIAAGKHVYCEWPLGNGLEEARELARLAKANDVLGVVGTQARVAPEILYLRHLIAEGFVGEVLSTSLIGSGMILGPTVESRSIYLLDRSNGANMLTIPVGHTLAAVQDVLGPIVDVSARLLNRRVSAQVEHEDRTVPMTAHDQVLADALLASGAPLALHYRGGMPQGIGLLWEINGTDGVIQVTAASGHAQMVQLSIAGARGSERDLQPIPVPATFYDGLPGDVRARNVAAMYARMADDIRDGTRTAPDFDDAVGLHRVIAAIERSSDQGTRIAVDRI
jgi:predicted dehydrogenase